MGQLVRLPLRLGSEPLVTKARLAEHLQVHPKTIERRVEAGMPCLRVGKRAVRFRIAECEAWLADQS
jgi:phage terminase Nu1 subunit (DNA packaging protein)